MSRLFASAAGTDWLSCSSAPVAAAPLTISLWGYQTAKATCVLASVAASAGTGSDNQFALGLNLGPGAITATTGATGGATASTSTTVTQNAWFHAAAVFASSTSRAAYLNGGGKGTNTTSKVPAGLDRAAINHLDNATGTSGLTGNIVDCAMWNIALSDADILALSKGLSPLKVHPEALIAYWPLLSGVDPELNLKSNTAKLSVQGSGAVSSRSPVLFRQPLPRV